MKVNIGFAQYISTIEFEPFLGDDIKEYIKEFEKWFFVQSKKRDYKNATRIKL